MSEIALYPDFSKSENGLVPAVVQDAQTGKVLMLGYMNGEAFRLTQLNKQVTFFSRSKNRLWVKGEASGNVLDVVTVQLDCDNDAILITAVPKGPVCHTGADTCWGEKNSGNFIYELERIVQSRKNSDPESSYTAQLFAKGINKVAQKVGEEAVELVIEAKDNNKELFLGEAADLMYHYLVLLAAKGYRLSDVEAILASRQKGTKN